MRIRTGTVSVLMCVLSTVAHADNDPPNEVWRIRSLSSPSPAVVEAPKDPKNWSGDITGLERLAASTPDKAVALLFVHGIGYTQQESNRDPFAFNLVKALLTVYGGAAAPEVTAARCKESSGGLRIQYENVYASFGTDLPGTAVFATELACLDRITVTLKGTNLRKVVIYRLLWDNRMWDDFEYPHVGFDDKFPEDGVELVDQLREKKNRELKSEVVTFGLSDAAMYIGPIGSLIREAIGAGLCAAIADASGDLRLFDNTDSPVAQSQSWTRQKLCEARSGGGKIPFAAMSHSLGSRAVFDVLTKEVHPELRTKLSFIANNTLEVYMLANQIPLLGLGMVDSNPDKRRWEGIHPIKQLKLVAISEVNDLLTYEIVPYFERLAFFRCRGAAIQVEGCSPAIFGAGRNSAIPRDVQTRQAQLATDTTARAKLVDSLGFDAVDIRVRFASSLLPLPLALVPFVDPMDAHSGHLAHRGIQDIVFCGVSEGKPRRRDAGGCAP